MSAEEGHFAEDHRWWVARLDVDASAARGFRLNRLPDGPHPSRADAREAALALAGEGGGSGPAPRAPGSVEVVGRAGTYWIAFDGRRSLSLELADADGDPVRLGVRLAPPAPPRSGPGAGAGSEPARRPARRSAQGSASASASAGTFGDLTPPDPDRFMNRRKLPIPLQAEGGVITLCGSVGGLLAFQGFLSMSHASAGETAVYSFVPAVVLLVASYLWHRNWYPRARRAYRDRMTRGR
ncbi:hypothetical protein [Streptomyces sedi]|uniref:Uncharacterized protein n=1 Tax=Streptomyces sedi TaxID=555059 RepID=A0A5C4VEQ8_9ACTN|nr:hypothetical protein [Streptomyces sedi]TNM33509.1 hypothetical protein FH715_03910 [Streptomyces sedi]